MDSNVSFPPPPPGATHWTCTACESEFSTADEQREHYKLDWHRYNLKRKVAALAPVPRDDFERRLAAVAGAQAPRAPFKGACAECRKSFSSEGLYKQHLASKRHKLAVAQLAKKQPSTVVNATKLTASLEQENRRDTESEVVGAGDEGREVHEAAAVGGSAAAFPACTAATGGAASSAGATQEASAASPMESAEEGEAENAEEDDREEGEEEKGKVAMGPAACIFCDQHSADVEENCRHMLERHGFFIPDAEYLVDAAGLVTYLNQKVKLGRVCLYCNGRGKAFHVRRAVQQHMMDVSHCKLLYEEGEDLEEFEPFYDFSASYDVDGDDIVDIVRGGRANGSGGEAGEAGMEAKAVDGGDGESEGWEEGEEGEEGSEEGSEYVHVRRTVRMTELGDLQLLDGRVVGHRDLRRYYKQRLRGDDAREAIVAHRLEQQQRIITMYGEAGLRTRTGRALQLGFSGPRNRPGSKTAQHALRLGQRNMGRIQLKTAISQNKLNRTYKKVHEC